MAAEEGFSLPVTAPSADALTHAAVESRVPHRGALRIDASEFAREWWIRGGEASQGVPLIWGRAEELGQLARAARAWHEGASLSDIRRVAPFVLMTGRFEVPDGDPVRLAESEWQGLRKEAGEVAVPGYRALVERAYAEPALRGLYPFRDRWVLYFSTTTRPDLTVTGPCLRAYDVDRFTVRGAFADREVLTETATAREAVAVAVRHLPSGLGPVTSGVSR